MCISCILQLNGILRWAYSPGFTTTYLHISDAFLNFLVENLSQTLLMSMRKTTLPRGNFLRSVHMEKSYLGKAGYPVLYNG